MTRATRLWAIAGPLLFVLLVVTGALTSCGTGTTKPTANQISAGPARDFSIRAAPPWVKASLLTSAEGARQSALRTRPSTNPFALVDWPEPATAGTVWCFNRAQPTLATIAFLAPDSRRPVRWRYAAVVFRGSEPATLQVRPSSPSHRGLVASIRGSLTLPVGTFAEFSFSWSGRGGSGYPSAPGYYTAIVSAWTLPGGNSGMASSRAFELSPIGGACSHAAGSARASGLG